MNIFFIILFTITVCFCVSYFIYIFCLKKKYLIKINQKLIKNITYLQENPVYHNNLISKILGCTCYIENARRNKKPVLIIGDVMCMLEGTECNEELLQLLSSSREQKLELQKYIQLKT